MPVIIRKLPAEVQHHLACEHGNTHRQLKHLRTAIAKEVSILETGQSVLFSEAHIRSQEPEITGRQVGGIRMKINFQVSDLSVHSVQNNINNSTKSCSLRQQ